MRISRLFVLSLLAVGLFALPATAQPEGWHKSVEEGVEAAAKSNKPLLLITGWKRTL
jgi:hypothetical protein